ncbi:MAG TPA: thioredoxin fold domain-containing protein [Ignavibacteria bacterium]|nr:thioredoxin fold domain-containing protein [Ignavibacteria bacterium]
MKKAAFLIALFFISSNIFSQIDFQKGSVAEVLAMAKAQNKLVMVDVMTDWCKWCIELDNKVYAKKEVSDFANANQINYKIDAEKGEGVDFAKKYKIQGFPSILFLDGDGNEIDRVYGYVPAKDFMEMMQDYNKGINTFSYLKAEVEKNPSNIEASLKLADKYSMYSEPDKAKELLNRIVELDGSNAGGKTDDAKFRLVLFTEKEEKAKLLEAFIKDNPNSDQLKDAYVALSETYYYDLSDMPSSEKWFKETLSRFPNDEYVGSSYGQYMNQIAIGFADKGTGPEDFNKGLSFIQTALQYVAGSVNEASSYYIQSKLYYNLKEYSKALESVDKALKIFDRKLYRDHKTKVEQQLSQK